MLRTPYAIQRQEMKLGPSGRDVRLYAETLNRLAFRTPGGLMAIYRKWVLNAQKSQMVDVGVRRSIKLG